MVPYDILRDLPVATDWAEVADAASKNDELRRRVNKQIAQLWARKTLRSKRELREWALSGRQAFETMLAMVREAAVVPYDMVGDPMGELFWRRLAATIAASEPFSLEAPPKMDVDGITVIVQKIIDQFKFLIEKRRLSEELYQQNGVIRPEKSAQRLFFAVAYAYCKANNLDVTPEADTGNGPVDFKVSAGFNGRVLVEIKLSTNTKLVKGYCRQLETYKGAEETVRGYYVVLDVGQMGGKARSLIAKKNEAVGRGEITSAIVFVDGSRQPPASKL